MCAVRASKSHLPNLDLLDVQGPIVRDRSWIEHRANAPFEDNLEASAKHYLPEEGLVVACNLAISLSAPLLVTGEPGTGKTQLAYWIGWRLALPVLRYQVKSNSSARELLYDFDVVGYFHARYEAQLDGPTSEGCVESAAARSKSALPDKKAFLHKGRLWQAFEGDMPVVLLIDEIDKAPRDFPNDLLRELGEAAFDVPETDEHVTATSQSRPIVVITSNSERRLPEPFLRRCVYHHLKLEDAFVSKVVERRMHEYPRFSTDLLRLAVTRFLAIRACSLRKKPATSELLMWLRVLNLGSQEDRKKVELGDDDLAQLPYLSTLLKDRQDIEDLKRRT